MFCSHFIGYLPHFRHLHRHCCRHLCHSDDHSPISWRPSTPLLRCPMLFLHLGFIKGGKKEEKTLWMSREMFVKKLVWEEERILSHLWDINATLQTFSFIVFTNFSRHYSNNNNDNNNNDILYNAGIRLKEGAHGAFAENIIDKYS